jgi:tyrosine ammonia-lyase
MPSTSSTINPRPDDADLPAHLAPRDLLADALADRPLGQPARERLPNVREGSIIDHVGQPPKILGQGADLPPERLADLARSGATVDFTSDTWARVERSAHLLRAAHDRGTPIYGLTTGFGPLVTFSADECVRMQGTGLISHLGAGFGDLAPALVVRATLLARAHTIGQGHSGIAPRAARAFLDLINSGLCPAVPAVGSVGASGDLIPLAHVARVLTGEGTVLLQGRRVPAREALEGHGLSPIELSGRDALALVNGTAFMTAYAALAHNDAERLIARAEAITGWIFRLLGGRTQALDPRLHAARGHPAQAASAASIRQEALRFGDCDDPSRPLQDVYSLRCAPQFLGACRDQLAHARAIISRELNGINDNPLVCDDNSGDILHGGNFQGQQISFAADAINSALVQIAVLVERQLDVLLNPELNAGAPLLLAWNPGATSGMAGAQITATALVAEMRHHVGPCAVTSIPTNGRNQDVVSMGTMSARQAFDQSRRLSGVLAICALGANQLNFLRASGKATGRTTPAPEWMPQVDGIRQDRALFDDIERISQAFLRQDRA